MKRFFIVSVSFVCFFLGTTALSAQKNTPKKDKSTASDTVDIEENPIILKFEPNYASSLEKRRDEMAFTRSILDTLNISENKRRKLLRDLYKNGLTKRLQKALIVETRFDEIED